MTATGLALLLGGYGAAYTTSGLKSAWPMVLALAVTFTGSALFTLGLLVWAWRHMP